MDNFVDEMGESEKENLFYSVFYDEMDSCLSTEFFLCDHCINEFKEKYKGIDLTDSSLQTNAMLLVDFHCGTRLSSFFTIEDFKKYIHLIKCPYCSHPLEHYFWPYDEFIYDIEEYQDDINEISKMASSTPFLLMTNPLAINTMNLIKELAQNSTNKIINANVYRARINKNPEIPLNSNEMGAVPDSKALEGRFNHYGHGHLYVATSKEICNKEIDIHNTKAKCIATIRLLKPLKILDLTDFEAYFDTGIDEDLYKAILSSALIYNSPSENTWGKPEYVFTRFVTDCAIFAGFDGIKYKSRYNFEGANYVIFKDKSKEDFTWDSIYIIENVESIN